MFRKTGSVRVVNIQPRLTQPKSNVLNAEESVWGYGFVGGVRKTGWDTGAQVNINEGVLALETPKRVQMLLLGIQDMVSSVTESLWLCNGGGEGSDRRTTYQSRV